MGREEVRREISCTLWRRFSPWISTHGSKEESFEAAASDVCEVGGNDGEAPRRTGRARPASRKDRREDFIEQLLLEKVFEGLARVGVPRRCRRGRGTGCCRLRIGRWRGIFFDGHAEFVKGAGVLRVFGRDTFLDWLGAFKLCAGIEKAALLAAVQFELALGTRAIGIEPGGQHGATIGASCAGDRADHAGGAGAELIGATRPAGRRLAIVGFVFFFIFFRVPVTAVAVLSTHKHLRLSVSTDCHNYNSCSCAVALANLACIQSDCYTRPDRALVPQSLHAEARTSNEQEMGHLCF